MDTVHLDASSSARVRRSSPPRSPWLSKRKVAVGDLPLDDRLRALVAAAREAMVNAAKWSGDETVSVYAEDRSWDATSVFVRDWGAGFNLESVAPASPSRVPPHPGDRHGVRESIVERMARHGGKAAVRTSPGEGTEVELRI